jgi:hypothetical protein
VVVREPAVASIVKTRAKLSIECCTNANFADKKIRE